MKKITVKRKDGGRLIPREKYNYFKEKPEVWNALRKGKTVEIDIDEFGTGINEFFSMNPGLELIETQPETSIQSKIKGAKSASRSSELSEEMP